MPWKVNSSVGHNRRVLIGQAGNNGIIKLKVLIGQAGNNIIVTCLFNVTW